MTASCVGVRWHTEITFSAGIIVQLASESASRWIQSVEPTAAIAADWPSGSLASARMPICSPAGLSSLAVGASGAIGAQKITSHGGGAVGKPVTSIASTGESAARSHLASSASTSAGNAARRSAHSFIGGALETVRE